MNDNHIESLEFLKAHGEQMETQQNDFQADPRFWVVAENKCEYRIADGYQDGTVVCGPDGAIFETVDELFQYLIENDCIKDGDFDGGYGMTLDDVFDALDDTKFYLSNFREKNSVMTPDTLFLTKQEAVEHIERNHYHYQQPHTYAMTAWRSPQVERLYEVLKIPIGTKSLLPCRAYR